MPRTTGAIMILKSMGRNELFALARDRVNEIPNRRCEKLLELGIVYDYLGDGSQYRVTVLGVELVGEALSRRHMVGKGTRPAALTDSERHKRRIEKIRQGEVLEQRRLDRLRAYVDRIEGQSLTEAYMLVRGIEETECVSCGCEIDYKQLRIFDRRKKYECVVCGQKVRPKKIPGHRRNGQEWHGRLPTVLIGDSGFAGIVCWDCVNYCDSCWTDGTYKFIAKVYGVDLRDS